MDSGLNEFRIDSLIHRAGFRELHSKSLIYIHVPVSEDDRFNIPVLEGFVMNRLAGDYIEGLLYKGNGIDLYFFFRILLGLKGMVF